MIEKDRELFAKLISGLALTFGRDISDVLLFGYWIGLNDLPYSQVESAVAKAMKQCRFMPTVFDLRELAGIIAPAAQAAIAFGDVETALRTVGYYRSPDFEDTVINATIRNLGGWLRVCEMPAEEFDKWFRKEFERMYLVYLSMGVNAESAAPLIGYFEQQNALQRETVQPPRKVPSSLPAMVLAERIERNQELLAANPVHQITVKKP